MPAGPFQVENRRRLWQFGNLRLLVGNNLPILTADVTGWRERCVWTGHRVDRFTCFQAAVDLADHVRDLGHVGGNILAGNLILERFALFIPDHLIDITGGNRLLGTDSCRHRMENDVAVDGIKQERDA